ncbi:hypothetical protein B0H21DRAFT_679702, partial [Amylocystis lapponica]
QDWIKQRLSEIVQYDRSLRVLHNSFAPVSRLPNELLVTIFRYVSWFKLMRVCHHWRDTILSTPALWAEIDVCKSMDFISMCLERSQDAALDI